jgi:hypothetical protein
MFDAVGISERVYFEWANGIRSFYGRQGAQAKIKSVKIITAAAKIDARHVEWLLERTAHDDFGRA